MNLSEGTVLPIYRVHFVKGQPIQEGGMEDKVKYRPRFKGSTSYMVNLPDRPHQQPEIETKKDYGNYRVAPKLDYKESSCDAL